jgi:hypothetical protein
MKKFEKRPRADAPVSTRTGPRARAAEERKFNDPYARAERPARPARAGAPPRRDGDRDQKPVGRPAVITLDADVARVFRDSETVNEALRMVMRLARFGGARPAFRDRPAGERPASGFAGPRSAPRSAPRGAPRGERPQERRGPPGPRTPRFKEE